MLSVSKGMQDLLCKAIYCVSMYHKYGRIDH